MIRVRISMICKDYIEANNKFLKSYNGNKLTSHIIYLDANSLYGHSMVQLLLAKIFIGSIQKILI